jgi:hypothetical protein
MNLDELSQQEDYVSRENNGSPLLLMDHPTEEAPTYYPPCHDNTSRESQQSNAQMDRGKVPSPARGKSFPGLLESIL